MLVGLYDHIKRTGGRSSYYWPCLPCWLFCWQCLHCWRLLCLIDNRCDYWWNLYWSYWQSRNWIEYLGSKYVGECLHIRGGRRLLLPWRRQQINLHHYWWNLFDKHRNTSANNRMSNISGTTAKHCSEHIGAAHPAFLQKICVWKFTNQFCAAWNTNNWNQFSTLREISSSIFCEFHGRDKDGAKLRAHPPPLPLVMFP